MGEKRELKRSSSFIRCQGLGKDAFTSIGRSRSLTEFGRTIQCFMLHTSIGDEVNVGVTENTTDNPPSDADERQEKDRENKPRTVDATRRDLLKSKRKNPDINNKGLDDGDQKQKEGKSQKRTIKKNVKNYVYHPDQKKYAMMLDDTLNMDKKELALDEAKRLWGAGGKKITHMLLKIGKYMILGVFAILWIYLMLMMLNRVSAGGSKSEKIYHAAVPRKLDKYEYFVLPDFKSDPELSLTLDLTGPFIPEDVENKKYDAKELSKIKNRVFECIVKRVKVPPNTLDRDINVEQMDDTNLGINTNMVELVMIEGERINEIDKLDYNNYPRTVRISIPRKKGSSPSSGTRYALGFKIREAREDTVPFSIKYRRDLFPMRYRVLLGIIPAGIFGALVALQFNPGVAAFVALGISATGYGYIEDTKAVTINTVGKWIDFDLLLYILFVMMFVSILAETKMLAFVAFYFVKFTSARIWPTVVLINALSGIPSIFGSNIYVALVMNSFTIRLAEALDIDPRPMLINVIVLCNVGGRGFIGTVASKLFLLNTEAINNGLTYKKLLVMLLPGAIILAAADIVIFYIVYTVFRPHIIKKKKEFVEGEQMMLLWNRADVMIPHVSNQWNAVKGKMNDMKLRLFKDMEGSLRSTAMSPQTRQEKYVQLEYESQLSNGFLIVKCIFIFLFSVTATFVYLYGIKMFYDTQHEAVRLGFIGSFILVCFLLMIHSRDMDLILKRVDWQSLLVLLALGAIGRVFTLVAANMDDFAWKLLGKPMVGTKREKILKAGLQILSYTSVTAIINEYLVVVLMLDLVVFFSKGSCLGAIREVIGGFLLATGACWGNATIIAAIPNLVVTGAAEQQGYRITFFEFALYGFPIALVNCVIVFIYDFIIIVE